MDLLAVAPALRVATQLPKEFQFATDEVLIRKVGGGSGTNSSAPGA
jgi:hypothetical protein